MAVFENKYSKLPIEFSEYTEKLDDVSKDRYFEKLRYVKEDGSIFYLPDPYMVRKSDWRNNMTAWPNITLEDTQTFLTRCSGKNINSLESYDYVLSGQGLASQSANLYIDSILNTTVPNIIRKEMLEPTPLSYFNFEHIDKILKIKFKEKAEYDEGLLKGLSEVRRYSECEGPKNIPGAVSIDCTLVFPNLETSYKGKVKYAKLPKVKFNLKGTINNLLVKVEIIKPTSDNYPRVNNFYIASTGSMTTHFTGLGPFNKYMKILEENYRNVVSSEVLNVIETRFKYVLYMAIASVPTPIN